MRICARVLALAISRGKLMKSPGVSAPIHNQNFVEAVVQTPAYATQSRNISYGPSDTFDAKPAGGYAVFYLILSSSWSGIRYMCHPFYVWYTIIGLLPDSGNASILSSHTHVMFLVSYMLASRTRTSLSCLVVPLRSLDKLRNGINRKW